ncbi:MAG: hypothetical protein ACKVOG_08730 [Rhodoglobus sp.]
MASDFDPRFDPAFQRGFEARGSLAAPVAPRFPAEETQRSVPQPRLVQPTLDRADAEVEAQSADALSVGPAPFETRGNPWLRALWIVAAVFVAGGVAVQFAAQATLQGASRSAIEFYVVPTVAAELSPWFLLTGLLAGVVALLLNAIRWRPGLQ